MNPITCTEAAAPPQTSELPKEANHSNSGLIKVYRILHTDRAGQEVHIILTPDFDRYDRYFINDLEYVPKEEAV